MSFSQWGVVEIYLPLTLTVTPHSHSHSFSYKPGSRLPLLSAGFAVNFPATERRCQYQIGNRGTGMNRQCMVSCRSNCDLLSPPTPYIQDIISVLKFRSRDDRRDVLLKGLGLGEIWEGLGLGLVSY